MKRTITIIALILLVSVSIIAGTLAIYTTTLEDLATGSTIAKEFILVEGGTDSFVKDVKIAPAESAAWQFSVKNYNGSVVSETAMDLDFDIDVAASAGKSVIAPLVITVTNSEGATVGTVTASGKIEFEDAFALSTAGQEKLYTVTVNWPSNDDVDIDYAGANFGTSVKVSLTGTQK